jgi:predicted nucleic acid-binding protein
VALKLIDSSVWIDFFAGGDTAASRTVQQLAEHPAQIAITQPVLFEVLAGAPVAAFGRIERVLHSFVLLDVDVALDFAFALELYRAVRRTGHTVRSSLDCLIASVAIRRGAEVIHNGLDFERIGAVAPDLKAIRVS